MESGGGGCGGGESGCRRHLPHLAVSCGEHPHLVDQHAATVELTALEQGHLPGVGALCAWNSFDDPVAFISVWMETWRRTWAASIWPRAKPRHQRMDPQRQRQREAGGGGNSAARRGRRCARGGATGARAEGQREPLRKLRGAPGLNATPARTRAQAAEAFLLMGGSCSRGGVLTQGPLREARWGRCMPGWGVRSGLPVQPLPCAANPRAKDSSRIAAGRGPAIGL